MANLRPFIALVVLAVLAVFVSVADAKDFKKLQIGVKVRLQGPSDRLFRSDSDFPAFLLGGPLCGLHDILILVYCSGMSTMLRLVSDRPL